VIQSDADPGIRQSVALPLEPAADGAAEGAADFPSDAPVESGAPVEPVEPVEVTPSDAGGVDAEPERLDAPRSFFAHPDPLKWIVGVANDLRIAPPQTLQCDGPWPWTPWTTSIS
jgi:hypothetical protein